MNKFIYLGSPHSTYHWVFITRREANLKTIEALRSTPGIRIGAQAVGHSIYFVGRLFAYLIGFKDPKFVVGYWRHRARRGAHPRRIGRPHQ